MPVIIIFFFGLCSFFAYRLGIKDGVKLYEIKSDIPVCKDKDFVRQYKEVMGYDFEEQNEKERF